MNIEAYVDGSYDKIKNVASYGVVLYDPETKTVIKKDKGATHNVGYCNMHNVGGEILAVQRAIQLVEKIEHDSLKIVYDYEGIEKWATGAWRANNAYTMKYRTLMNKYMSERAVSFFKVKSHTGNTYNEMADALAKEASALAEASKE